MNTANEKLQAIQEQLKNGVVPPRESVRSILSWFGASRRGYNVVARIRAQFKKYGIKTTPDFEYSYIDSSVLFVKSDQATDEPEGVELVDPTHRVSRLASANRPPVTVSPDSTVPQIITLMLTNDFSQLPVMCGTREVKGIVSWKTLGSRLALKRECKKASECMEPAQVITSEQSLFSAIDIVAEHDYVLVRTPDNQISGIITAADFNEQFRKLSEPFLLVGEIEHGVRMLLHGKFSVKELEAAKNPEGGDREITSVADLTFGEYIALLQPEKNWKKINIEIDRIEFTKRLDRAREIRNDVMHFDPDGLDDTAIQDLREMAQFLKRLRDVGVV
jgi:CBS domain-containing protein